MPLTWGHPTSNRQWPSTETGIRFSNSPPQAMHLFMEKPSSLFFCFKLCSMACRSICSALLFLPGNWTLETFLSQLLHLHFTHRNFPGRLTHYLAHLNPMADIQHIWQPIACKVRVRSHLHASNYFIFLSFVNVYQSVPHVIWLGQILVWPKLTSVIVKPRSSLLTFFLLVQ